MYKLREELRSASGRLTLTGVRVCMWARAWCRRIRNWVEQGFGGKQATGTGTGNGSTAAQLNEWSKGAIEARATERNAANTRTNESAQLIESWCTRAKWLIKGTDSAQSAVAVRVYTSIFERSTSVKYSSALSRAGRTRDAMRCRTVDRWSSSRCGEQISRMIDEKGASRDCAHRLWVHVIHRDLSVSPRSTIIRAKETSIRRNAPLCSGYFRPIYSAMKQSI